LKYFANLVHSAGFWA